MFTDKFFRFTLLLHLKPVLSSRAGIGSERSRVVALKASYRNLHNELIIEDVLELRFSPSHSKLHGRRKAFLGPTD